MHAIICQNSIVIFCHPATSGIKLMNWKVTKSGFKHRPSWFLLSANVSPHEAYLSCCTYGYASRFSNSVIRLECEFAVSKNLVDFKTKLSSCMFSHLQADCFSYWGAALGRRMRGLVWRSLGKAWIPCECVWSHCSILHSWVGGSCTLGLAVEHFCQRYIKISWYGKLGRKGVWSGSFSGKRVKF